MKNIELTKEVKQKEFAKKYYNKRFEDLNDPQSLVCSAAAEIFAYIDNVIPEGVRKHTIFDFNGFYFDAITKDKKNILTDEVAVEVRNLICKYCWDVSWEEIKARGGTKEEKMAFLRKHSVIMDRFEKGNNVIVSHRSGETNHAYIIDLAIGIGAKYVKIGSPCRGERVSKFNRLIEIEELLKYHSQK